MVVALAQHAPELTEDQLRARLVEVADLAARQLGGETRSGTRRWERGDSMSGKHGKPPWWRRGIRRRQASPPWPHLSEMVDDAGLAHLVTDEAYQRGMREGTGCYVVLCGRQIAVASMVARPDHYCEPCHLLGGRK